MQESCRTCGEYLKKSSSKNIFQHNESIFVHQIEVLTGLWLENTEDMPSSICAHCQRDLRHAVEFRERVITTQAQFQQNYNLSEMLPEVEMPAKQEGHLVDEEMNMDIHKVIYESDIEIETEAIENNLNIRNQEGGEHLIDEHIAEDQVVVTDCGIPQDDKHHESKDEVQTQPKKRQWKKDCVCDQCGKHFQNLSNFKLHMLRHGGVKDYECNICGDKFYTRHFLRQHKRRHTDERPFACHYCDSRFRSWSNRVDHERSHTNERPFQCRHCDKRFYTCSIRADHELVHTGVRKFHCEVCDQWFLRRTHLVTHNRSKVHKSREQQKSLEKTTNSP